jgi:hypothetical protein
MTYNPAWIVMYGLIGKDAAMTCIARVRLASDHRWLGTQTLIA